MLPDGIAGLHKEMNSWKWSLNKYLCPSKKDFAL
jgi:hypothetical protein